ncbi:MAG: ZIP family metal transporter [Thermotogae bacterium]|nr:ZIP family metal transporter [Thermotogota bacterium]
MSETTNLWKVFIYALITAIATGLGALPFAFFRTFRRRYLGIANAIAAGLMITASFGLINEGINYSLLRTLAGVVAGLVFIILSHKLLHDQEDIHIGILSGVDARKVLMIIGVMVAHSFAEGVGIGVSFGGGEDFGVFISLAIAIHNIPEGLAVSLVMVPRGISWVWAGLWAIFTSLPQPLMAVPSYMFVEMFRPFLPVGLGFAAGAMLWIAFSELLSDALKDTSSTVVATTVTLSVVAMTAFQVLIKH